jgi:CopG family nickel-responsive transcriptional regulator
MPVARIGVSLEGPLLREFDRLVDTEGFASRSEALRNLIRESLSRRRVAREEKAVGTITFLYRHDVGMVSHRIVHRQHDYLDLIRASAHVHLGEESCLEVLLVEGKSENIQALANRVKTVKGVLFAESVMTSPALY